MKALSMMNHLQLEKNKLFQCYLCKIGGMDNVIDIGKESELGLQNSVPTHFCLSHHANALGKVMNPSSFRYGLNNREN